MARNIIGIVTGLAVWLLIAALGGIIMRELWPAYASIEDASAFTLPMLFARLSIGAVATIGTGFASACVTQSRRVRLIPGVILLIGFAPVHMMLWSKFPVWYHLCFLLTLVPLTYLGNSLAPRVLPQRSVHFGSSRDTVMRS